ncbi:hypothetical protein HY632_01075 [Candidatus Uhrbacteria bacterium]|nr:hypothetical protein [Candidatus Uhrbacteria bacterium]
MRDSLRLNHRPWKRRLSVAIAIVVMVMSPFNFAKAQGWPVSDAILEGDVFERQAREQVQGAMKDSFGFQLQIALINLLQTFGQNLAYEGAVFLSSGGKAHSPLFDNRPFLDGLADAGLGAGLQFVDDLDKNIVSRIGTAVGDESWNFEGGLGIANYICAPSLPNLKLSLKLGIEDRLQPKPPLCSWQTLSNNWGEFVKIENLEKGLSNLGVAFEPGQSDLSAALELHVGFSEQYSLALFKQQQEKLQKGAFKDLQSGISNLTKTPAKLVEDESTEIVKNLKQHNVEISNERLSEALGQFNLFPPMLAAAGQALAVNTAVSLVSQTVQKQLLEGGLFKELFGSDQAGRVFGVNSAPLASRAVVARQVFSDLQRPRFGASGNYDALGIFGSCDPSRRQLYTCVIDSGFTQAVRQANGNKALSVADAIAGGYLHRDWPLVREGTAADQDPLCYQGPPNGGYCASNLAKLRGARIIPIGWELAANHPRNIPGDGKISGGAPPVTLGRVIDAFNKSGDDGKCGTGDANEDEFCGLIDPNWILRYPDQQCRLRAPTEILAQAGSPIRSEECRDAPSCLAQDADGRCITEGTADRVGGYGYCVREKSVWHLNGTSCPASAASCRVLTPRVGNQVALLTSTVDRGVCNAGNAGCAWYSTARSTTGWRTDQRRYFTGAVERCQERDEGCTELIDTKVAQRNLIRNGGFTDDTIAQRPLGWDVEGVASAAVSDDSPVSGPYLRCRGDLHGNSICKTDIDAATLTTQSVYTLSASVRVAVNPSGADAQDVRVAFQDLIGANQACAITIPVAERDGQWRSYQVRCTTDVRIDRPRIVVFDGTDNDAITTIDVDDLMLLEGDVQALFHEGYAAQAPRTYLKVAPADLRCDDVGTDGRLNTANDDASCTQFARACTVDDVGCERYTPVGGGVSAVDGRVTELDACPVSCVGYAAFREVESNFDGSTDLAYFIPSTARQCSAEDVGCSEFTVLDAERGGERREYYTDLRRCDKPGTGNSATYYTWEGSDQQGYQIRSFALRASTADPNSAPEVFGDATTADCQAAYGKSPGQVGYDPVRTPDCRAFYSQNGTIFHRPISRTVIVTDDCVQFRASHVMGDALCVARGGVVTSGQCIIRGHRPESRSCSAPAASCRAYRGNAGGAVRTIVATDFESLEPPRQGWSVGTPSSESLIVSGRSLRVGAGQTTTYPARETVTGLTTEDCAARGGAFTAESGSTPSQCVLPLLHVGGTYEVLLVGRGAAEVTVTLREQGQDLTQNGTSAANPKSTTFGGAWRQANLGPFILTGVPSTNALVEIAVGAGRDVYLDQIVLREVPQLTTVVKNSWNTPQQCDRATTAPDAAPLARGMLGCRAYQTRSNEVVPLRSFTKLCTADVVGCTSFHDTRNSTSRESQTFNDTTNPELDDVTVPADGIRYLVNDPKKSCAATAKGCRRFGVPTLDRVGVDRAGVPVADQWKDVLLRDDPDRYTGPGAMLCRDPELFCEEYRGTDGALFHFKDPGNRVCEFRKDVTMGGVVVNGWFRKSIDPPEPCDAQLVRGGNTFEIAQNSDPDFRGWAGTCDATQNLCTEFRDPTDRSFAYPEGRRYYALRPTVDLASCAGNTSRKEGCVLLDETSNLARTWSAPVSYAASEERNGDRAPVTDCDRDPASCRRCVRQARCTQPDGTLVGRVIACTGANNAPCGGGATVCEAGRCRTGTGGALVRREEACENDSQCDPSLNEICTPGSGVGLKCTADTDCREPGTSCERLANDANIIVQVKRDRQCSQWYERAGCYSAFNERLGRTTEICSGIQLMGEGGGDILRPAPAYLTLRTYQQRDRSYSGEEYSGFAIPNRAGLEFLHQAELLAVSSSNPEHGVLLPAYCPANLRVNGQLVCGAEDARCPSVTDASGRTRGMRDGESCGPAIGTNRCVWRATCAATDASCAMPITLGSCRTTADCAPSPTETDGRTASCEPVRGICLQSQCLYPAAAEDVGRGLVLDTDWSRWESPACKAYPATDAPFPRDEKRGVLKVAWNPANGGIPSFNAGFEQVALCRQVRPATPADGGLACECSYRKLTYGGAPQYYATNVGSVQPSICVGGRLDGKDCRVGATGKRNETATGAAPTVTLSCQVGDTADLAVDGTCTALQRNDLALGVQGYCLERDLSMGINGQQNQFACRSFFPVDQLEGTLDVNSFAPEAGYQFASTAGRFMCVAARGNALPESMRGRGQPWDRACTNLLARDALCRERNQNPCPTIRPDEQELREECKIAHEVTLYPSASTPYWVAVRLESQYDDNGNQEGKALFTTDRGPGDTTGLEKHPFVALNQRWNDDAYSDGDPIVDRAGRNALGREREFWSAHDYLIHEDEIESIEFRAATDWGGGADSLDDNDHRFIETDGSYPSGLTLTKQGGWSVCADGNNAITDGSRDASGNIRSSLCWTGAQVSGMTWDTPKESGHNFNDDVCEDDDRPTAVNGTVTSPTHDTYFGVKAIFDPASRTLRGFRTGFCKDVATDDEFIGYDIFLVLKEMCTEVRRVGRDGTNFAEAKPWTNRVWSGNPRPYSVTTVAYQSTQAFMPFGTANGIDDPMRTPTTPWYVAAGESGGAPYACVNQCLLPTGANTIRGDGGEAGAQSAGEGRAHEVFASYLDGWRWQYGGGPSCNGDSAYPGIPCANNAQCGNAQGTCIQHRVCGTSVTRAEDNPPSWYYSRIDRPCAISATTENCRQASGICMAVSPNKFGANQPSQQSDVCVTEQYRLSGGKWELVQSPMRNGSMLITCNRRAEYPDAPCAVATGPEGTCELSLARQCSGGLRNGLSCANDTNCAFPSGQCSTPNTTQQSGYTVIPANDPARPTWDVSGVGVNGVAPQVPVVQAIGDDCDSDGKCLEGPTGQFTINGQRAGDIVGIGGRLRANVRFFFHANENQMPIRELRIEAGDGKGHYVPDAGSYANRRGRAVCDGRSSFGQVSGACVEEPWSYWWPYRCIKGQLPTCTGESGRKPGADQIAGGCWDPTAVNSASGAAGACVYVPRVYLKDNWGWCTGQCGGTTSPGGTGCYDNNGENIGDECDTTRPEPWTQFSGRVLVFPR